MTLSIDRPRTAWPRPRWLLLASLALNLFFVGIAGAFVTQYLLQPSGSADRNDAARIEQIASSLPKADGDLLRTEFAGQRAAVEAARDTIRARRDAIRATLRKEPFVVEDMRALMAESRAARQSLYAALQNVVSTAASRMSPEGRNKLADWRSGSRS